MRLITKTILVISIIALMAIAAIPSSAIYPTSFGNKYPVTVYPGTGSFNCRVSTTHNAGVSIPNAYVAIVNASNVSEEYFNGTTDQTGMFQFSGVNATFSSSLQTGPDGLQSSFSLGKSMYMIYANKSPYGEGYSQAFGVDTNNTGINTYTIYLPGLSSINFTADPFLDTTNGSYSAKLTAYVYNDTGDPVPDGTVIDFSLNVLDWTYLNGSLNGNNSQYASVTTTGGKAEVTYGWFPGNVLPTKDIMVTATLHGYNDVNATLYLTLRGGAVAASSTVIPGQASPTAIPVVTTSPVPTASPVPTQPPNGTSSPIPTPTPTPTPLSPMIVLLAIIAGAAIITAKKK
jgi:hypothetical protein